MNVQCSVEENKKIEKKCEWLLNLMEKGRACRLMRGNVEKGNCELHFKTTFFRISRLLLML